MTKSLETKTVKPKKVHPWRKAGRVSTKEYSAPQRLEREKHPSFSEENYDAKGNQRDLMDMLGLK